MASRFQTSVVRVLEVLIIMLIDRRKQIMNRYNALPKNTCRIQTNCNNRHINTYLFSFNVINMNENDGLGFYAINTLISQYIYIS